MSWSLSSVSTLLVELSFRTHSVALLNIRRKGQLPCIKFLLSSTNTFIKKLFLTKTICIRKQGLPFWYLLWKLYSKFPKNTLQRFACFKSSYNLKFLETTTRHNTYGVVSWILDGSFYKSECLLFLIWLNSK